MRFMFLGVMVLAGLMWFFQLTALLDTWDTQNSKRMAAAARLDDTERMEADRDYRDAKADTRAVIGYMGQAVLIFTAGGIGFVVSGKRA